MTKVLFILSAVVMGVACFFAYQNNRAFADARNAKASTHRTIKAELVGVNQVVADISAKNGEIAAVQKDADTEDERLKAHTVKISQLDSESKRTAEETDSKNKKLEELKAQLAKLPADVKPETLSEDRSISVSRPQIKSQHQRLQHSATPLEHEAGCALVHRIVPSGWHSHRALHCRG